MTDDHMGDLVSWNLYRLGMGRITIPTAELAELLGAAGRPMSRQRAKILLDSAKITPKMMEALAEAVGVEVRELLKPMPPSLRKHRDKP